MGLETEKTLEQKYVMPTFGRYPVEFVQGEGMHLIDSEGKRYLDFLSGIGVCSLGHCHPAVVSALIDQTERLIHVSNYFYIEHRGEVAKTISDLLNRTVEGESLEWKSFFANSGAEANECAIKLARLHSHEMYPDRPERSIIITLEGSFHGRTLASLAATGQPRFHAGFEPIPSDFMTVPINDELALKNLFESHGKDVCAVLMEPIQGESGVHPCDRGFMELARELCDEHEALLIVDEVQSGIFRTGSAFAFQDLGIVPDIVTIAKGVASGMPCAACAAKPNIANTFRPGHHGSTFGGSNLAMAAALATLTELSKPDIAENIKKTSDYLFEMAKELPSVKEIRGRGLMVALELEDGKDAHEVVVRALEQGLVINATGDTTIRLLPPLICGKDDIDEFAVKMREALE